MNAALAALARSQGFVAFGKGLGERNGQYLVDHCWSESWTGMANYRGLELAAEFEWTGTRPAIEEDFVKLADIRAKLRLFVGNLRGAEWKAAAHSIATSAADMLADHNLARDDTIVLALGPKGKRIETTDDIAIWAISKTGAAPL